MQNDALYLLPPGFANGARREYCPECAELWGLLAYYPAIKESLHIHYVSLERPRLGLADQLGQAHQNAPTLIIKGEIPADFTAYKSVGPHKFIDNARDIGLYFGAKYGTALPRGHFSG